MKDVSNESENIVVSSSKMILFPRNERASKHQTKRNETKPSSALPFAISVEAFNKADDESTAAEVKIGITRCPPYKIVSNYGGGKSCSFRGNRSQLSFEHWTP